MASNAVHAYVRDIIDHHAGHRQQKLQELATRIKAACGEYAGTGPVDAETFANWLDLQYVEGYLETGSAIYQDCIDNHARIERRVARHEQQRNTSK